MNRGIAVAIGVVVGVGVSAGIAWWRGFGSGMFRAAASPVDLGPVPVAEPDRVRFVLVGDAGYAGPVADDVAASVGRICAERGCDFGVWLGDNLYPAGMETPDDPDMAVAFAPFEAALQPWYVVLGNHDYGDSTQEERAGWEIAWADDHPSYRLPSRYFRFQAGPAAFWGLDTTDIFWNGGEDQAEWMDLGASDARWKIVLGHHTWRSSGGHGNAGAYEGYEGVPIVSGAGLKAFFETELCGEADLYASGHDHHLELDRACDVPVVVSGGGSKAGPLYPRGNEPEFVAPEPGFVWVELADGITMAYYGRKGAKLHEVVRPHPHAVP